MNTPRLLLGKGCEMLNWLKRLLGINPKKDESTTKARVGLGFQKDAWCNERWLPAELDFRGPTQQRMDREIKEQTYYRTTSY